MPPFEHPVSMAGYGAGAPQHHVWSTYGYGSGPSTAGPAAYDVSAFPINQSGSGITPDALWWTQMGQHGSPRSMSPNSKTAYGGLPSPVHQFPISGTGGMAAPWPRGPTRASRCDRKGLGVRHTRAGKAAGEGGEGEGAPCEEPAQPHPGPGSAPRLGSTTPPLSLPPPQPGMSPAGSFGSSFGGPPQPESLTIPPDMMPSPPAAAAATGGRKRGPGRPRAGGSTAANEGAPPPPPPPGGIGMIGQMGMMDPACVAPPGLGLGPAAAAMGPDGKGNKGGSAAANKKRYVCEICQKRFSTAWYVRVHRKSHNGERPYICHNCGKGFMLPNVLQVHLRKCEKTAAAGGGPPGPSSLGGDRSPLPPAHLGPHLKHPNATRPSQMHAASSPSSSSLDMEQRTPPQLSPSSSRHSIPPMPPGFPPSDHIGQMPFGRGSSMGPLTGAGGPGELAHLNQRFMHGGYPVPPPPATQLVGDQQQMSPRQMGLSSHFMPHSQHDMQQQPQLNVPPQQHPLCENPVPFAPGMYSTGHLGHQPPSHNQNQQHQQLGVPPTPATSASIEYPPIGPRTASPSSSPAHFLGNDRPRDKGGGGAGSLGGGGGGGGSVSGGSDCGSVKGASPDLYCTMCEIQFEEKLPLEEHLKSHRPYSCEVCDKRFSQKCNLITHMRLHTGGKIGAKILSDRLGYFFPGDYGLKDRA